MLLTVDVGNTNTVLGLFDGDHLYESYRIKTDPRVTADELALMFRGLLVGPPGARRRRRLLDRAGGARRAARRCSTATSRDVPDVVVGPGVKTGVPLLYRQPARGRPRPHRQHPRRAHALRRAGDRRRLRHVDELRRRVARKGEFLGGALAPGIEISRRRARRRGPPSCSRSSSSSRGRSSARTPSRRCSRACSTASPARSTASCERIADELDEPPVVLATGGLSHLMYRVCQTLDHHEPDLTLIGLRLVFERNA